MNPKQNTQNHRTVLSFPEVNYFGHGTQRLNAVTVDIELRESKKGPVLSICGNIWNARHTDVLSCGQNIDKLLQLFPKSKIMQRIHAIWEKYHLNDMKTTCEHQRELGWEELVSERIATYQFIMSREKSDEQKELKRRIRQELIDKGEITLTDKEKELLSLEYFLDTYESKCPEGYVLREEKIESRGWVRESEHPKGLLGKPCPICGYRYGTSWNYMPIPKEVLEEIKCLIDGTWSAKYNPDHHTVSDAKNNG